MLAAMAMGDVCGWLIGEVKGEGEDGCEFGYDEDDDHLWRTALLDRDTAFFNGRGGYFHIEFWWYGIRYW